MQNEKRITSAQRGSFSSFYALLSLLFFLLFVITVVFVFKERARKIESEVERVSQVFLRGLNETLSLSVENLRSASNFIVFFQDITFGQFLEVTAQNFDADPGLFLIEWQRVVPDIEREVFVENARKRGLPDFRLWEPDESGRPISARKRPEHVPVYFMHSRGQEGESISTLGLDLAWSVDRMRSKWAARDSGRARASKLFNVVTSTESGFNPLGFAITLPIYAGGYVPGDLDRRKAELTGYMAGVFDLEKVSKSQFERTLRPGVNLDIHDADHDHSDSTHRFLIETGSPSRFQDELAFDLYGTELHLRVVATQEFVRRQFELVWLVAPATVLLFGLTTFLFLRRLEKGHQQLADAQIELRALNTQLKDLSQHDPLTNLFNRRAFAEKTRQEMERIDRHKEAVSLLMLDLDHFKGINDRWGHSSGDKVLTDFAAICQSATRNIDMVARWGGEEFAILLSHTNCDEAYHFAERLRQKVEETKFALEEHQTEIGITVSIGISTIDQKMAAARWFEQADKALYLAKQSGRNCVRVFG